jgi:hypothetical protein
LLSLSVLLLNNSPTWRFFCLSLTTSSSDFIWGLSSFTFFSSHKV